MFNGFNTMITKKTQAVSSNLFVFGVKMSVFVPKVSRALRNFPNFFALDFHELLDALGKRWKLDIIIRQGFKKLLNGLLDSSFFGDYHRIHIPQISCLVIVVFEIDWKP